MNTKAKKCIIAVLAAVVALAAGAAAVAQGPVPPPYGGMKNPFPWDDAGAQKAGKRVYEQQCLGCHGVTGSNLNQFDFSSPDYPTTLEAQPDHFFWVLSEGRLQLGMPPYKGALTETERWQTLNYLWLLGNPPVIPPTGLPADDAGGTLQLSGPAQAMAGESLAFTATLHDAKGQPIADTKIRFFIKLTFFASGLMEIGQVETNTDGVATIEFAPRVSGNVELVAKSDSLQATSALALAEAEAPFYEPEVAFSLPQLGPEVFIGPASARELGPGDPAPTTALRLPGGLVSWLFLLAGAMGLIWFSYFRVFRQLMGIPIAGDIRRDGVDTRIMPRLGMTYVVFMGVLLILMIMTGPYSHFHVHP